MEFTVAKISAVVLTLNEEKNIRNCLECIKWVDEIIIVDSYSEDETVTIAREYTSKIFMYERMGYADPARQFALEKATNEWILVVDADELVPKKLRDRLLEIAAVDNYDVVLIPRKNYCFGNVMNGVGWGSLQDLQIRFFKKQMMHYTNKIHDFTQVNKNARIYKLLDESCSLVHFSFLDVEHFLEKTNRYTTIEAKNYFLMGESIPTLYLLFGLLKEFMWRFIILRGYKDGFQGFALSVFSAVYRLIVALKLNIFYHLQSTNSLEGITKKYQDIANEQIREYAIATDSNTKNSEM